MGFWLGEGVGYIVVLSVSDFPWDVVLVDDWILKEHVQTLLILRQWMACNSGKKE